MQFLYRTMALPDSRTPQESIANARLLVVLDEYIIDDADLPAWLDLARTELEKLEGYFEVNADTGAAPMTIADPVLLSQLAFIAAALRLRLVHVEHQRDPVEVDDWGRPMIMG